MENSPIFDITHAKFSIFNAGINKPWGQRPALQGTLADVYSRMNSTELLLLTQQLRAIGDERQQREFKANSLPFVTFSGQFAYRNAQGLVEHSGLLCIDIDHLEGRDDVRNVRQMLIDDEYFDTELMFTSPRGNGVKWVTHIDLARATHQQWYAAIREHLHRAYGIETDAAPSNVASACFLCYDANLIINPQIAKF